MPLVPADALSGCCLSHAINSASVLAGKSFLAMITLASKGSSETGSKSLRRSYGSGRVDGAVCDVRTPGAERIAVEGGVHGAAFYTGFQLKQQAFVSENGFL